MPVPVESRSPGGARQERRETDAMPSGSGKPDLKLDGTHDAIQNGNGRTKETTLGVDQDAPHLPSPSPTPSPRGASSLRLASDSLAGLTGTPSSLSARRRYSGTYEKPTMHYEGPRPGRSDATPQPLSASKSDRHTVSEEKARKPRALVIPKMNGDEKVFKLTAAEMEELTSAPDSLPRSSLRSPGLLSSAPPPLAPSPVLEKRSHHRAEDEGDDHAQGGTDSMYIATGATLDRRPAEDSTPLSVVNRRPGISSRRISSPHMPRNRGPSYTRDAYGHTSPRRRSGLSGSRPENLDLTQSKSVSGGKKSSSLDPPPSPIPQSIPLPPMSIPTYLQLELSSSKPSPLYIYRSSTSEAIYESSKIKFERLLNFLLLPPQLEQILYFGTLACLDAWLHTFTILPLRFLKAVAILIQWWGQTLDKEIRFIGGFIYHGSGRMWHRQRGRAPSHETPSRSRSQSVPRSRRPQVSTPVPHPQSARPDGANGSTAIDSAKVEMEPKSRQGWGRRHRRVKSQPSALLSSHKADLLQGAVIICSCIILMKFDASRMYHSIRGQAAIKLYVIYNVLEVCDKLFAALGQDIFECLFSNETLERDVDGRSKILRPFGMFILALIYNVIHAAALLYQVITLNVAVNSYSNALLTLLMSNQFVEIKSSVFKKIEKDNLFQLTCADVVERFQLWLMLMIIALRNIVEVGGLSILSSSAGASGADTVKESIPIRSYSILPNSFTILPNWTGEVLSPFLLVLGSEMLVDWVKHAYINKFNNVKPAIYQRYLDVLAKDYYANAFVNQSLIKRLGLPVIPLSCLFIRSSFQTYHMFLATHFPPPLPSAATELAVESATESPATMAAFDHFDTIIRKALGRSAYGIPDPTATARWYLPSADDAIAAITMLVFFLGAFFVLLACKLVLGMLLLRFARNRYSKMKTREHTSYDTGGRRQGGWGVVEMDEAKRRWFYDDDPDALKKLRDKERAAKEKQESGAGAGQDFGKISRYEMVKRIW